MQQGELMIIGRSTNTVYYLPCGDLCASTCLEQADDMPTYLVSNQACMITSRFGVGHPP